MKSFGRLAIGLSAMLAIGCGGFGDTTAPLGGTLFEFYLAMSEDGTAHLVEYEVSQGFTLAGPFSGLPAVNDAVTTSGTLGLVASARNEPTLLSVEYDGLDPIGTVKEFPVSGATTLGAVGYDEWNHNLFVVVDETTVKLFHVEPNGDLTGGTTVISQLPDVTDMMVASSTLYVVTDKRVYVYTLTYTGLPVLMTSVFAFHGIASFKLSRGGSEEGAYLLTNGNRLRIFEVDLFGVLIPVNTVDLDFDLVKKGIDIAPFSVDACLVTTEDGEVIAVLRGNDGLFYTSFSAFLGGAGNTRSIEVDYIQARLLVSDESGTVRGYLLQYDGDIGAVTADTTVAVGAPVRTKLLSIKFTQ